jgi:hypothetical protein
VTSGMLSIQLEVCIIAVAIVLALKTQHHRGCYLKAPTPAASSNAAGIVTAVFPCQNSFAIAIVVVQLVQQINGAFGSG